MSGHRSIPGRPARVAGIGLRSGGLAAALAVLAALGGWPAAGGPGAAVPDTSWPVVGGDAGMQRASPLEQVNRENVGRLRVAWTYHTRDAEPGDTSTIECTPVVVGERLYLTTVRTVLVCLDAATGREIWKFDPLLGAGRRPIASGGVNRGVAYWRGRASERGPGAGRIFLGTSDGRLFSLDAASGTPDPAFGDRGSVDLRLGLGRDISGMSYGPTSPPAVFEDTVIVGVSVGEGPGPAAPGDIRAFDARTGREVWSFHTVPRPGELGHDTWEGDSWKDRGGVNAWGGLSVDTKRGLVFAGLGSASYDFYGGDRKGQNLFANCTICLDARTGQRRWHFQTLHHDIWDHDLPVYPNLVTVRQDGRERDAVAQVTKTGYVYLFDRETGATLFPVEERPVPGSDVPGEQAWPTQPVPVRPPPFAPQFIGADSVSDISPEARTEMLARISRLRHGPAFLPLGLEGTIMIPGTLGGATWSGACVDPATGWLYVSSNNLLNEMTLEPALPGKGYPYQLKGGYNRFRDSQGYPGGKPPWGTLTAIDLNRGNQVWQVPLGEYPELTARGIPRTGTETFGGAIVTAGGLVFIGGSKDERFHAYDKGTGRLLWEAPLPAGGYATPCAYAVGGRQYLAIAAGGGGKQRTRSGDAYVAFALP